MLVASLLLSTLASASKQIKNGIPLNKNIQSGVQPLLDGGVYPFNFGKGNLGLEADRFFIINVPNYFPSELGVAVAVFDCYCGGDTFAIVDNGVDVTVRGSEPVNATPLCTFYNDEPKECVSTFYENLGIYYSATALLAPGFHNITIKTGASPFGAGTAFLYYYTTVVEEPFLYMPLCFLEGGFNLDNCYFDVASF